MVAKKILICMLSFACCIRVRQEKDGQMLKKKKNS